MSAFSYSAPHLSNEERKRERSLLTSEEKDLIKNDLIGNDSWEGETEELRESGLLQIEKVISEMNLEEKAEYMTALIEVPELVKRESPPIIFLRKHKFDVVAAARNLIIYWTWRVKLFKEKAFLPMTIRGALQDDFDTLSTGFAQILGYDNHGRVVFYHDKHQANPKLHHRDSLCRVVFYMIHVACMNREAQKKGCVIIVNYANLRLEDFDRLYTKTVLQIDDIVAPIRLKAMHVQATSLWFVPPSILMPISSFVMPKNIRLRINFFDSVEDLETYGILPETLPTGVGGTRDVYSNFDNWIDAQIEKETVSME